MTAQVTAGAIVDALIACGVREAVLSPGSRSAPLAFALAAAEREQRLRLHVRIDERSAGFLALGLAKASGLPVPVVVTSGSAVANLFPAVVEASASGVPLLVLSADRPPVLRGVGASQTIDQLKLFGGYVRRFDDLATGADYAASVIGHAVASATSPDNPGPVHVNCPFAEPLVPSGRAPMAAAVPRAVHRASAGPEMAEVLGAAGFSDPPERGLIVVGDGAASAVSVDALANACGWPVIAEPTAGLHDTRAWVPAGSMVAGSQRWLQRHRPDVVLSVGRVGLTRPVLGLLRAAPTHIAVDSSGADPLRTAAVTVREVPIVGQGPAADDGWLRQWRLAGERALRRIDEVLDAEPVFTGLHVARHVWRASPATALLFLASSWPIRQVFATQAPRDGVRVLANRGANGIDGLVSTAWGAALAHDGPSVALLGDLAFLHDGNGLLAAAGEERPPLTYVIIDNDGGGIFSQLEQGDAKYEPDFERIFGTPHGLNLLGRARLSAVAGREVEDLERFAQAFAVRPAGVSVLVAAVGPRAYEAQMLARLQSEVSAVLA